MDKVVKVVIDGVKHDVTVSVPDVPTFASVADGIAFFGENTAALLSALQKGAVLSLVRSVIKDAKRSYIDANFPGRSEARKMARQIFATFAKKLGLPELLKDARKANPELAEKAWEKAVARAKATLAEDVDLS